VRNKDEELGFPQILLWDIKNGQNSPSFRRFYSSSVGKITGVFMALGK
jgi:hypothetical protein